MKKSTVPQFVTIAVVLTAIAPIRCVALDIVIDAQTELLGNQPALDAFNRAAAKWESIFTDPITVTVVADVFDFGSGNESVIGSAAANLVGAPYDLIRNQMIIDASDEPSNAVVGLLPTASQLSALLPAGFSLWDVPDRFIVMTTANAKAAGFAVPAAEDALILFNSSFTFDYDNSDGVSPGTIDFESVAIHEIGHSLGFVSVVDDVDYFMDHPEDFPPEYIVDDNMLIDPYALDLFRFSAGSNPTSGAEFTAFSRNLTPGGSHLLDDLAMEYELSTGAFNGDGNQASHWRADEITSTTVGIMDPTISYGFAASITAADIRSLDLIGWDVVPEPSTYAAGALVMFAVGGVWVRSRRRA